MRFRTTLVLALAVLAAAALFWIYKDRLTGLAPPPEKPEETLRLVDVAPDDVASATLEAKGPDGALAVKLALKKADKKWRLAEPVDYPADEYEAMRLVRAGAEARFRRTIVPGSGGQPDLAGLGLDPPAYRLTLVAEKTDPKSGPVPGKKPAATVKIEVGRKPLLAGGVYARLLAPQEKVVLLDKTDLLERAEEEIKTYRSRDLLDLRSDDLVRIEISGAKGGSVRFDRGADQAWVLAEPVAARADPDTLSTLVRETLGLRVKEFVADAPGDLERYGLAKPRVEVALYKKGEPPKEKPETPPKEGEAKPEPAPEPVKVATLKFGSWADIEKKTVHLTADDGKHVTSVVATALASLEKTPQDFRDKRVVALDASKVSRLSLKNETGEFEFAKTAGKWRLKVADRPEADADPTAFDDLLKEAGDLKVLYFSDPKDAAGFGAPQGYLRVQVEGEPNPRGFEVGGAAESGVLVRNLREDWVGRVNENDLKSCRKPSYAFLSKQVLKADPKKMTRVAITTPDRTIELAQKDGKWRLVKPVEAEPEITFTEDLARELQDLSCLAYVAATTDYKPYGLETGAVVCTVTVAGEKAEDPATEQVLRLATQKDAKVYGRVDGRDLVFEVPTALRDTLAAEPLAKDLVTLAAANVTEVEIAASGKTARFLRQDTRWYRADAAGKPEKEVPGDDLKGLTEALGALKAKRWAAYDTKAAAEFGLDQPPLSITAKAGDKTVTLLVSDKEVPQPVAELLPDRPLRYAMVKGGERIAIIGGPDAVKIAAAAKAGEDKPEPKKEDAPK